MKEKKFMKAVNLAIAKKQDVIVIYVNNHAYKDLKESIKNGNLVYEKVVNDAKIKNKKYDVCARSVEDDVLMAFTCIPIKRLKETPGFFNEVLEFCNKHLMEGPFVLIPSNKKID